MGVLGQRQYSREMRQVFEEATSTESKNTGEMIQLNRVVLNLYSVLKANTLDKYPLRYSTLFFQADLVKY